MIVPWRVVDSDPSDRGPFLLKNLNQGSFFMKPTQTSCTIAFEKSLKTTIWVFHGVSKNRREPPKWMVYFMENPMNKWMIWGEKPIIIGNNPSICIKFDSPYMDPTLRIIGP